MQQHSLRRKRALQTVLTHQKQLGRKQHWWQEQRSRHCFWLPVVLHQLEEAVNVA
jgi:endonuclease III-like uncharacterized protein